MQVIFASFCRSVGAFVLLRLRRIFRACTRVCARRARRTSRPSRSASQPQQQQQHSRAAAAAEQQSSSAMAASTADALVLRVEIPTFGIQTRQTKKFRPTATVDEVLTTLKTTLHPCLSHPHCAKHASSGRRKQHEAAHKPRAGHALTIVCLRFPVFLCPPTRTRRFSRLSHALLLLFLSLSSLSLHLCPPIACALAAFLTCFFCCGADKRGSRGRPCCCVAATFFFADGRRHAQASRAWSSS